MFEIGFCLGLGIPVKPIRDSTIAVDSRLFAEIGVLDNLGYIDFQNAHDLAEEVKKSEGPQLGNLPRWWLLFEVLTPR